MNCPARSPGKDGSGVRAGDCALRMRRVVLNLRWQQRGSSGRRVLPGRRRTRDINMSTASQSSLGSEGTARTEIFTLRGCPMPCKMQLPSSHIA
eukprot:2956691-Rhodomonas_salina.1